MSDDGGKEVASASKAKQSKASDQHQISEALQCAQLVSGYGGQGGS